MKRVVKFCLIACLGLVLVYLCEARIALSLHPSINTTAPPRGQSTQISASTLMQQGRQYYRNGQFLDAMSVWQQAYDQYVARDDILHHIAAANRLALAAQQLGQWDVAQAMVDDGLVALSTIPDGASAEPEVKRLQAQVLNTQGRLHFSRGRVTPLLDEQQTAVEAALITWKQSETLYQDADDWVGVLGSQINQAQSLRVLGFHRQRQMLLEQVQQMLVDESEPVFDPHLRVAGVNTVADALMQVGHWADAEELLETALNLAQSEHLLQEQGTTLLHLGNLGRSQGQIDAALRFYTMAAEVVGDRFPVLKTQAELNQLSLLVEHQQWQGAAALLSHVWSDVEQLPLGRPGLVAQVNVARTVMCLNLHNQAPICEGARGDVASTVVSSSNWSSQVMKQLKTTQKQAEALGDRRLQSYALGNLGQLYEQLGQPETAKDYTEKALELAQQIQALDIAYQWQWQLGRLVKESDLEGAIAAYTEAVTALQILRNDLVSLDADTQFNFRQSVEPVYRELVDLLLAGGSPTQAQLQQARSVIEGLQLAELNNFFQDACLQAQPEQIDTIVDTSSVPTAALYGIVLPNSIDVILKLPHDSELRHYRTSVAQETVTATIEQLRRVVSQPQPSGQLYPLAQEVYDWLLRPMEMDLASREIESLAFVLDYSLQNIPLAVLDDGEQHLVEKYALSLNPGLQLLEPSRSGDGAIKEVLLAGVGDRHTIEARSFPALTNVTQELAGIQRQVDQGKVLLNDEAVTAKLKEEIESLALPVVHIATHGNFSSNPNETFIVLWDQLLSAKDMDMLLQSPDPNQTIELLVLSACQTATGDQRAALGLAGVTVRSRARSTLATLWQVNDASTAELMQRFYQVLQSESGVTKAEALRQAQLYLLREHPNQSYRLPYYWSPFVLVGNWL